MARTYLDLLTDVNTFELSYRLVQSLNCQSDNGIMMPCRVSVSHRSASDNLIQLEALTALKDLEGMSFRMNLSIGICLQRSQPE